MERLIRYGTITDDPLYNCSARTPEMIEKTYADPDPIYGSCSFALGVINLIVFMLCVKVMLEPAHFVYPAYKIMIAISCCDMIGTAYNSLIFGVVYYAGLNFCDSPDFIYIAGTFGASAWVTGSMLSSVLIINRTVELNCTRNKLLVNVFNGKHTPFVILFLVSAGLYFVLYEPTIILDRKSGLAFWDPLIYDNASSKYFSKSITFNNTVVVSFNSISSIILCFSISKHLKENFGSMIDRRRQLTLFFQCLAVVSLCNIGASIYLFNYLFFSESPQVLKRMAGVIYQLCTCLPPYIYMILNHSIRHGIIKMFTRYNAKPFFSTSARTTTHASCSTTQVQRKSSISPVILPITNNDI